MSNTVAIPLSQVRCAAILLHLRRTSHPASLLTCFPHYQGAGYGVVIGLGALFALGMIIVSEIMKRRGNVENAEEFTGE